MKRLTLLGLTLVFCLLSFIIFVQAQDSMEVLFWTRPNPLWTEYWEKMAVKYNDTNPVIAGKKVTIKAMPMPTKPSSEAAIQMSISAGTIVGGSENIVTGFASLLASEGQLVALDELPGFWDLIKTRAMTTTIKRWTAPDGHIYIVPNFSNPKLYVWRIDILKKLAFEKPPVSYNEALELGKRLKEKYPDKFLMADDRMVDPTWWKRWGDFFPFYYANTNTPFMTGNKLTANDKAAIEVFDFLHKLYEKNYLLTAKVKDPFVQGLCVWKRINSWDPVRWKKKYPEMVFSQNYIITGPIPSTPAKTANFFTDEKGLVIYTKASPEEKKAIWDFYKFVLSNPKNDALYFETTGVLPVRGDVTFNPIINYLLTPETELWSKAVSLAIPSINHPKFSEIMEFIGIEGLIPAIKGEKSPEQAWIDVKVDIETLLKQ